MSIGFPEEQHSSIAPSRPLHNGPYILLKQQAVYCWEEDMKEIWWTGRGTAQGAQQPFFLCEVCLSGGSAHFTTIIQPAIVRVMRLSQHPHLTSLVDVFSEDGHQYFVFEAPGESLPVYLQRVGGRLALSEALHACQSLLHLIGWLSRQQPATQHGSICPEHVRVVAPGHWMLSHVSILQGSAATNGQRARITPAEDIIMLPDGIIGQVSDLYALMATVLLALTGQAAATVPVRLQQVAGRYPDQAELLSLLFTKALHPIETLRAQHPEALFPLVEQLIERSNERLHEKKDTTQDAGSRGAPQQRQVSSRSKPADPQALLHQTSVPIVSPVTTNIVSASVSVPPLSLERQGALPLPESLPPLPPAHDGLAACIWTCSILFCLCCLFLLHV